MAASIPRPFAPALVLLAALCGPTSAAQEDELLTDAPPRPGRGLALLAFAGESQPVLLARALRLAGSREHPGADFSHFLGMRSATVDMRPRDFGLEVRVEAPSRLLGEVLAATGNLLAEPAWTDDVAQNAALQLALTWGDPLDTFEQQLELLLDGAGRARYVAQLAGGGGSGEDADGHGGESEVDADQGGDHGLDADDGADVDRGDGHARGADEGNGDGDDGSGDDGDGDGGFPFDLPPIPAPSIDELEALRGAMLLGPRRVLIAVEDDGEAMAAALAVLRALPPGDLPTPTPPAATPAIERLFLAAVDEVPGALVGWTAPLSTEGPDALATVGIAAWEQGPLTQALAEFLQPGTRASARLTEAGEGPLSIRVRALVQAPYARDAAEAIDAALAGLAQWSPSEAQITATLDRMFDPGAATLAPGEPRSSVRVRRALYGWPLQPATRDELERALAADPSQAARSAAALFDLSAGRTLIAADEAIVSALGAGGLASTWRLDRSAASQAGERAAAAAAALLEAVGGREAWAALETIRFRSETQPGSTSARSAVRTAIQWRDLARPRFVLEELAQEKVTTIVTPDLMEQHVEGGPSRRFGVEFSERMLDIHRATLIVLLHELAASDQLAPQLDEAGILQLSDIDGLRSRLTIGDDGRPASAEGVGGTTEFRAWTEVEGIWLPLQQRSLQPPANHTWSEIELNPATPGWLQ
ncbi:hypothetical protein [Engelhardtia mirabilis]|uniref:Uncharacterized protein n=1 Tax=Engelhardtia mirabilis TaxID=2528011 RepID=A0A518BN26_9BACT|nr:hypothetical protein Pla133_34740 [Planctomycetes bacterium Pla133]QDV02703.1 hypothetical protein Pla86_34720 [Planctomycetes bacterium Pla86]